jgi:hypothetical protein
MRGDGRGSDASGKLGQLARRGEPYRDGASGQSKIEMVQSRLVFLEEQEVLAMAGGLAGHTSVPGCRARRRRRHPVANGTQLQVRVQATPLGTGASNARQKLTFTRLDNARVTVSGQNITAGQTHTPPANTVIVDFTVARVTAGQPTTVHITVVDGCGEWRTFVGGGAGAGF